jgi:signal transduction histidine kinase
MEVEFATSEGHAAWERRFALVMATHPYILLAISTILSLLEPGRGPRHRLVTLGLAALAAAWVLVMFTWLDSRWPRRTTGRLVYYAGLLVLCGLLVAHSTFFIAFACTCFIQGVFMLPGALAFAGVAASSVIVYVVPNGFPVTDQQLFVYVLLIGLQTLLTGTFGFLGMRRREAVAQRQQLIADRERALEENAGLHVQLLTQAREAGVLDERSRVAREIHDTLAQGLTGIIMQLEAAQQAGDLGSPGWRPHVDEACELVRESLVEARRSVQALRPAPLEESRLPDAIAKMARRWSETSSLALTFHATGEPRSLQAEIEVTLFRAAQEALTNVARHARASRVGLTVSYLDDVVLLDVRDDGIGFDVASANGHGGPWGGHQFGLRAMGQRLRQVGGGLEIESAPGAGTALHVHVPATATEAGP